MDLLKLKAFQQIAGSDLEKEKKKKRKIYSKIYNGFLVPQVLDSKKWKSSQKVKSFLQSCVCLFISSKIGPKFQNSR